ncbi:MAG: hypothetical protein ABS949_10995 [Solibacillus sp.]
MPITATVVNKFAEKEHSGHVYSAGDIYPAAGFEATFERVSFLAQVHPSYKKIYLANMEQSDKPSDEGFPKHTGGGWYELLNGEKVQGKDEATEAEQAFKNGE